jgi:23S rRNA (uridine2552-2'-O)-methyltransferase
MPAYNPRDKLMFKAHVQGFRARSVFKLEELDQKFRLFYPGQKVLDVGAAPGSWLQYTSEKIGPSGFALGLDLQEIAPVAANVATEVADISSHELVTQILSAHGLNLVDLIISDIAPNTSGIAYVDQLKSIELNRAIFELAKTHLKPGGKLVMKVFPGEHFDKFLKELKLYFKNVSVQKVKASRESSREVYVICKKGQH